MEKRPAPRRGVRSVRRLSGGVRQTAKQAASERRYPISAFVPVLLALTLVAGLFIGRNMSGDGPTTIFNLRQPSASDKIGQVLDLIERKMFLERS